MFFDFSNKISKLIFLITVFTAIFIFPVNSSNAGNNGNKNNNKAGSQHFVLVPGAWHGVWCYYELADSLKAGGHRVTLVELPGHGINRSDPASVTLYDYQGAVVRALDRIEEQVILVGHSMGGIAVSMAAEARPLKIKKLVYLAAFLVPDGKSLLDISSQDTGSKVLPNLIVNETEGFIDIKREELDLMFYHQSESKYVELAGTLIRPNPLLPFVMPLTLSEDNYGSVRRFYIKTTADNAVTPEAQERMLADLPCELTYTINSDHSPFFSEVKKLVKILNSIAAQ